MSSGQIGRECLKRCLSSQTLVNLAHGCVPLPVLKELMGDGLHEEVRQLTEWSGPDSMLMVWRAVTGGVLFILLQRKVSAHFAP
jgi:RNA-dependent RNA polymerase